MSKILKLTVSGAKPLRHGQAYVWGVILELTRERETFTYRDVRGVCDPEQWVQVRDVLGKLEKAGYLGRLPATRAKGARPYILLKRQAECPVLKTDGSGVGRNGLGQQHMWNVMRRARHGFTVEQLAIDASTDDVPVTLSAAKQYCLLLERAGMLRIQNPGQRGVGRNVYVLLGSANTGPKSPQKYQARFVFDRNRECVVGNVLATEDRT